MGNSCCRTESPCGSVEERSGLLKNDSKALMHGSDSVTCGPKGDDDIRKTHDEASIKVEEEAEAEKVRLCPENEESEPNNTQENGPLQKDDIRTSTPSPAKEPELKEHSNRAQVVDVTEVPANGGKTDLLQCNLTSPPKGNSTDEWEIFPETVEETVEENPASVEDRIPDGISPAAELKTPPQTETTTSTDSSQEDNEDDSKVTTDDTEADPLGEFSQNNELLSEPNTQLTAAAPVSVVCQEINSEPSCAVTEGSENGTLSVCKDADLEDRKSPDVSESSGSESTGLNHSGEDRDATNSVGEPVTAALADASESQTSNPDEKPGPTCFPTTSDMVSPLKNIIQDVAGETLLEVQNKDGDDPKAKESEEMEDVENTSAEAVNQEEKDVETQEATGEEQQVAGSTSTDVEAEVVPVAEKEASPKDGLGNSEEDLYRGAEELSASQNKEPGPPPVLETTHPKLEDRCSLAPAVDILSYSETEWKGNTAKSALIRKGYKEMSQRFGSLRRVRGDNYCALRATLFQVLSHSTELPAWLQEENVTMLLKELEAEQGLISQWTFPGECFQGDGMRDVTQQLKGYMELLQNKWQAAVDCSSAAERQQLCESVFQGGEEELGLLEALKLLMLWRAVQLHSSMQAGGDVPLFCWLLFARDTSDCPRSFLSNHLSRVGLSAGLEQVEMFLLGHALQCTLQVYRLYKADTEEFVTYYPDDHKDDWPSVCLVSEDDRHYNVPVADAAELPEELTSS